MSQPEHAKGGLFGPLLESVTVSLLSLYKIVANACCLKHSHLFQPIKAVMKLSRESILAVMSFTRMPRRGDFGSL